MASDSKVEKLVQASLSKKTQPKAFVSLLSRLDEESPIPDIELANSLLNLSKDRSKWRLQHQYVVAFANENVENLRRIMVSLPSVSVASQREYILYLKGHFRDFKELVLQFFVNQGLTEYTAQFSTLLLPQVDEQTKNLWFHVLFLWGTIIDTVSSVIQQELFRNMALDVMSQLQSSGFTAQLAYFSKKASSLLDTTNIHDQLQAHSIAVKRERVSPTPVRKAFALSPHSKKVIKVARIKKLLWLNDRFRSWNIEKLMEQFTSFFRIDTSKYEDYVKELVEILFTGMSRAIQLQESPYVLFNWKNFIVSRFPTFLKETKPKNSNEGSSSLESIILKTISGISDTYITEMIVGGRSSHPYDIRKVFLRSCMYQDLVTVSSYTKTFPEDSESVTWSHIAHEKSVLNHTDHLRSEFNSKLLDVNTEFTSLGESKFVNFLEELPSTDIQYSTSKQEQLRQLVLNGLEKLIREKSNEKLVRLVLGLSVCPAATNFVYFNDPIGPWGIINPLIAYLDSDTFGADEDDSNFQETFSYFGNLMTASIALTKFFGVDLVSVNLECSYTIDFMNNYYYRLCINSSNKFQPVEESDIEIVNKFNDLTNEWTNALFDVNNDGISDDLIKSVKVKQIYKLVFVIFQSAITANIAGILSSPNLSNGIDYLSQDFLAPSSAELIHWIVSNIGPLQRNSDVFLQILWKIIQSNLSENKEDSSEVNYTFRLVLNLVGKELLESIYAFRNWEHKDIMLKLVRVVKQNVDEEYNRVNRPLLIQHQRQTEGDSMASTIRHALQAFLNEDTPELEQNVWRVFRTMWKPTETEDILALLLKEIRSCHGTKANQKVNVEDGKIIVDFLAFLIVLSSQNAIDVSDAELNSRFSEVNPRAIRPMMFKQNFTLDMADHYASILGDTANSTDANAPNGLDIKQAPKDDLMMDFEMDDLFNDKGDDLFGDASEAPTSRPPSPPLPVGTIYKDVSAGTSILRRVLNQIQHEPSSDNHDANVLKIVLQQQLEHFLSTSCEKPL